MAWFTAKEWKNRLVEFAGRRSLKNVSTNETTVYDVTRNEGQVSQEGDSFSATTMNDLEQRISDAFAEAEEANAQLSSDLGGLSFGQDAEGNWGYKPSGADAVIPFSSQVIGQAIWGNINAANKGYTQVDIGFRPKKLIGYTVDASNPSTLAIEVIYFNIWGNDDIVHRRAVSRYYDEVMGDDPNRLVITDTGFTMYNSGVLWVGKTFYYMAFRT